MSNIIKTIKDAASNIIYPQTLTKAVYDESNNRLDNTLTTINDKFTELGVKKIYLDGTTLVIESEE